MTAATARAKPTLCAVCRSYPCCWSRDTAQQLDTCRSCTQLADTDRGHSHTDGTDDDMALRAPVGMRPEFRDGVQVGWACAGMDACGFVARTDHYTDQPPRIWQGPTDELPDEPALCGLTEDEYADRCVPQYLSRDTAYVEDPHSTAFAVVTSLTTAKPDVWLHTATGDVMVTRATWWTEDAIDAARVQLAAAAFAQAERTGNLTPAWILPPTRPYQSGAWVRVEEQPGRLTTLTAALATVTLHPHIGWAGDPNLIEFGEGDPVQVDDPATDGYIGLVDGYFRNDQWIVRDNRSQCTTVHHARHLTRRPDLPHEVDPVDADTYRRALADATDLFGINRAQASEAVEIIYTRGVAGELSVNDVMDLVADAVPHLDTEPFVGQIAAVFRCRTT